MIISLRLRDFSAYTEIKNMLPTQGRTVVKYQLSPEREKAGHKTRETNFNFNSMAQQQLITHWLSLKLKW